MSKNDEIKKLKERIEALEFIKELQQDIIVDFEKVTGQELSKKYLPEALANEIARKKKSFQSKMVVRMFRAKQTGLLQKTKGAKTNRRKCSCINELIRPI